MKYIITLELECDAEEIIGVKEQIASVVKAEIITVTNAGQQLSLPDK